MMVLPEVVVVVVGMAVAADVTTAMTRSFL